MQKGVCRRTKNGDFNRLGGFMSKPLDDIPKGSIYGCLKVIEYAGCLNHRSRYRCQCNCGKETITEARSLISGKTRSCGCLRSMIGQAHTAFPYKDYIGKRFDRLLVLEYSFEHLGKKKSAHLICQCDCGNKKVVCAYGLRTGNIKSCGCKHEEFKEIFRKRRKEYAVL